MTSTQRKKSTKKADTKKGDSVPSEENQTPFRFDQALGDLEAVVQSLESGELGLEEALGRFEEGVKLTRLCQQALDQARQRVEVLAEEHVGQEGEYEEEEMLSVSGQDEVDEF